MATRAPQVEKIRKWSFCMSLRYRAGPRQLALRSHCRGWEIWLSMSCDSAAHGACCGSTWLSRWIH